MDLPTLHVPPNDLPAFIPVKSVLWNWLEFVAREEDEMAKVHHGIGDAAQIQHVVERWRDHIRDVSPDEWDRHFIEAILIEYCDPDRIGFPEADRYEELMRQWDEGLFCPEPV